MQTKIRFQEKVDPQINLLREKSVYTIGYEDLYAEAKIITTERWIACEILRYNYIEQNVGFKSSFSRVSLCSSVSYSCATKIFTNICNRLQKQIIILNNKSYKLQKMILFFLILRMNVWQAKELLTPLLKKMYKK